VQAALSHDSRKEDNEVALLKAPPKQPRTSPVQIRLDDEAKAKLAKYAEFIDCSSSYVVGEALKLLYRKDTEFQSWLAQHTNNDNPAEKTETALQETK
jgi:hypothetical protein